MGFFRSFSISIREKMKLFGLFATAALANNGEGDRLYSNEVSFWSNIPADGAWWYKPGVPEKNAKNIREQTTVYFDNFIPDGNKAAERVAIIMQKALKKTLSMSETLAEKPTCQNKNRKRRDAGTSSGPSFKIDLKKNNLENMKELFVNYARYARNELQDNCPRQSMRILKRSDRLRRIWFWHTCDKGIDSNGKHCGYFKSIEHPRD